MKFSLELYLYLLLFFLCTSLAEEDASEKTELLSKRTQEVEERSADPWFLWPWYLLWNGKVPTSLKFRLPPWDSLEFVLHVPTPWDVFIFLVQFTFIYTIPILIQMTWVTNMFMEKIVKPNIRLVWNANHYFEDPYAHPQG